MGKEDIIGIDRSLMLIPVHRLHFGSSLALAPVATAAPQWLALALISS